MIEILETITRETLRRLSYRITTQLPGLIAGLLIFLAAYVVALLVRWLLVRLFKGAAVDRFMRRSGLWSMFTDSGTIRGSRMIGSLAFWAILLVGFLTALDAFDTQLTSTVINSVLELLPRLVAAGAIMVAGVWLGRFLGRGALVWAFGEGIPSARRIGQVVRVFVIFAAAVVAADNLGFAEHVFLAAFIIVVGGAVLSASLALGLEGRHVMRRFLTTDRLPSGEDSEDAGHEHL
jgi:hypothetical protein